MRAQMEGELREIEEDMLKMSTQVEELIELSLKSLLEKDLDLANRLIGMDKKVDSLEMVIEKKCLDFIALQGPIAGDLRKVSAIWKIITDLERIGDHCVNIARVVIAIGRTDFVKPLIDLPQMGGMVRKMVNESVDSFIQSNPQLAIEVAKRDDEVDSLYKKIYMDLFEVMHQRRKEEKVIDQVIHLLFIGRHLERIADHTTNICERIIYMTTGERMNF